MIRLTDSVLNRPLKRILRHVEGNGASRGAMWNRSISQIALCMPNPSRRKSALVSLPRTVPEGCLQPLGPSPDESVAVELR
jgi:hypothetical protein